MFRRGRVRANRFELLKLKKRLELAERAHKFLEEKHTLLRQEYENIRGTLTPLEQKLTRDIVYSYSLLAKAIVSYGLRDVYTAAISITSNDRVTLRWSQVRGITVPRFENLVVLRTPLERGYILTGNGCAIDDAATSLEESLNLLVSTAELQNIAQRVEEEMIRTRTLTLALEKILIPQIQDHIHRIVNTLEEREREQYQRSKWVLEILNSS